MVLRISSSSLYVYPACLTIRISICPFTSWYICIFSIFSKAVKCWPNISPVREIFLPSFRNKVATPSQHKLSCQITLSHRNDALQNAGDRVFILKLGMDRHTEVWIHPTIIWDGLYSWLVLAPRIIN